MYMRSCPTAITTKRSGGVEINSHESNLSNARMSGFTGRPSQSSSQNSSSSGVTPKIFFHDTHGSANQPTGMIKLDKAWKSGGISETLGELIAMRLSSVLYGDRVQTAQCEAYPIRIDQSQNGGRSFITLAIKSTFDQNLVFLSDTAAGNRLSRSEAVNGHVMGEHLMPGKDYGNGLLMVLTHLLQDTDFIGFMAQNCAYKVRDNGDVVPMVFDAVFSPSTLGMNQFALTVDGHGRANSRFSADARARTLGHSRHLEVRNLSMLNDSSLKDRLAAVFMALSKGPAMIVALENLKQELLSIFRDLANAESAIAEINRQIDVAKKVLAARLNEMRKTYAKEYSAYRDYCFQHATHGDPTERDANYVSNNALTIVAVSKQIEQLWQCRTPLLYGPEGVPLSNVVMDPSSTRSGFRCINQRVTGRPPVLELQFTAPGNLDFEVGLFRTILEKAFKHNNFQLQVGSTGRSLSLKIDPKELGTFDLNNVRPHWMKPLETSDLPTAVANEPSISTLIAQLHVLNRHALQAHTISANKERSSALRCINSARQKHLYRLQCVLLNEFPSRSRQDLIDVINYSKQLDLQEFVCDRLIDKLPSRNVSPYEIMQSLNEIKLSLDDITAKPLDQRAAAIIDFKSQQLGDMTLHAVTHFVDSLRAFMPNKRSSGLLTGRNVQPVAKAIRQLETEVTDGRLINRQFHSIIGGLIEQLRKNRSVRTLAVVTSLYNRMGVETAVKVKTSNASDSQQLLSKAISRFLSELGNDDSYKRRNHKLMSWIKGKHVDAVDRCSQHLRAYVATDGKEQVEREIKKLMSSLVASNSKRTISVVRRAYASYLQELNGNGTENTRQTRR